MKRKPRKKKRICRKIGYPTAGYARNAMKKQQDRGVSVKAVYLCPHCDVYHLTKQTRTERRIAAELSYIS